MKSLSKRGIEILSVALLLGIIADVMLRRTPWGLNISIFVASVTFAFIFFKRRYSRIDKSTVALTIALLFFGLMFVWRSSEQLLVLDGLACITIFAVLALPAIGVKVTGAGVAHFAIGFIWSGISAIFGPLVLMVRDIDWSTGDAPSWRKKALPVLRGVLMALPLLLVFGALFVAADAAFEGAVNRVLDIPGIDKVIEHSFFIAFFSWIGAGYLRGSNASAFVTGTTTEDAPANGASVADALKASVKSVRERFDWMKIDNAFLPRALTLGAVETGIALGLVNALFLAFVLFQIPYFFGGFEFVQNTPDFKLSEYARRGFGELVAVAAITLPVLLASHWLLRRDTPAAEKTFRVFAGIQIALLFVIMVSALQRLMLLTSSLGYGWTTTRFYPLVFMLWLAVVFIWFTVTVLRGNRNRFAWAAMWSALVFIGALNLFNPDKFIVESNVRLMNQGRPFDGGYNGVLSNDAVPELTEALPLMDSSQSCLVSIQLRSKLQNLKSERNWLTFNFSRNLALKILSANQASLDTSSCPGCLPFCDSSKSATQ